MRELRELLNKTKAYDQTDNRELKTYDREIPPILLNRLRFER